MQPAVSVSVRGVFAALIVVTTAHAIAYQRPPSIVVPSVPPQISVDASDHLAYVIAHRRYGEIEAAHAAIDPASPHAPWVPTAIELAIAQLDMTATAYVRMGMCSELSWFMRRIESEWPAGFAAMRPVSCPPEMVCGYARGKAMREAGSIEAYRMIQGIRDADAYVMRMFEISTAVTAGDHVGALAACSDTRPDRAMPEACVIEACRAGELAIAEVLFARVQAGRAACAAAGVTFDAEQLAHGGAQRWQPADLVRVHPDAP